MSMQETKLPLLAEILDEYEKGTLDMSQPARKCHLNERERIMNKVTWIHNDELKNQLLLKRMSSSASRDLLKGRKLI